MSQDAPLILVGGNGPAGSYLMQRLVAAGLKATVISRRPIEVPEGFTKLLVDLNIAPGWIAPAGANVISFLPLWILSELLPRFKGVKSVIAVGSTSRFSKASSSDARERATAEKLERAEAALKAWAEKNGVVWTILRPTIIYNGRNDANVTRMAKFIKRWHFLPLASPAKGLRQPIHTDDVASAALNCLNNPGAANKAFNISGGEVLSYRAMAERIFAALQQKPHFVMLPTQFLQKAFGAAARLGVIKEASFGAAIFQRMNEDLIFDVAEGLEIIDYRPRSFRPEFPDL